MTDSDVPTKQRSNRELIDFLNLPRHELVSLFGPEWQDPKVKVDDKLSPEERIALIPKVKPFITQAQSIQDAVIEDMRERKKFGVDKYGTALYPFDGKHDFLQELYEELLDAACYIKAFMYERDHPSEMTYTVPPGRLDEETGEPIQSLART